MVHRSAVAVACALLAALALASGEVYSAKQLSGPPEEFADHMIPAAAVGAESSSTETYWVKLAPTAEGDMQWASHVPVDSTTFEFAIFSQEIASLTITLKDPSGATVDLASHKVDTGFPTGDEAQIYDDATFQLTNMVAGVYTLELSAPAGTFEPYADSPAGFDAFIMFMVDSNDMLFTQFADYTSLVQGQQVTLLGRMFDQTVSPHVRGTVPQANLQDTILSAELEARFPDGHWEVAQMHDDGLHGDGEANDGEYGGSFAATQPGTYLVQATFQGKNLVGEFMRVSQQEVAVSPQSARLAGHATGNVRFLKQRLDMYLALDSTVLDTTASFRGYAEVWGTSKSTGQLTPVAWSGAIVTPQSAQGAQAVKLELDLKWLRRAGVKAPLMLKNVYLQDVDTQVPITTAESMALKISNVAELEKIDLIEYDGESITLEMMQGITPDWVLQASLNNTTPKLIMIHGFCAASNVWAKTSDIWGANALYFSDPNQGRSNDAFAKLVLDFISKNGVQQCAYVGFSQGGLVSAHLLNNYFTCADANPNTAKKRLQTSVGSPYLGSSGTNWVGILGSCPVVTDLTLNGAALWGAGITAATWAKVNYYTTQYKQVTLGAFCNAITNLVLKKPNDGVTELVNAQPKGAVNQGNTIGECHVEGMKYPASFLSRTRNTAIRAAMAVP